MATVKNSDDKNITVKVGDSVCFKADYETYGTITKISGSTLTIKTGGYDPADEVCYYTESANRCWIEG